MSAWSRFEQALAKAQTLQAQLAASQAPAEEPFFSSAPVPAFSAPPAVAMAAGSGNATDESAETRCRVAADVEQRMAALLLSRDKEHEGTIAQLLAERQQWAQDKEEAQAQLSRLAAVLRAQQAEMTELERATAAEAARGRELARSSEQVSRDLAAFSARQVALDSKVGLLLASLEGQERAREALQRAHDERAAVEHELAEQQRRQQAAEHREKLAAEEAAAARREVQDTGAMLEETREQLRRSAEAVAALQRALLAAAGAPEQFPEGQACREHEEQLERLREELSHTRTLLLAAPEDEENYARTAAETIRDFFNKF